ncbi:MAG TPA: hypothetical protein VK599_13460 [Streptosporangiaceae bacterium]|nr:hypothetical protein [Streptosporangiaceae bacterium]
MKGWDLSGKPVELTGWHEGGPAVTLASRGKGGGKSVMLYTAARYARARAKGRPLRDDPVRDRDRQEGEP